MHNNSELSYREGATFIGIEISEQLAENVLFSVSGAAELQEIMPHGGQERLNILFADRVLSGWDGPRVADEFEELIIFEHGHGNISVKVGELLQSNDFVISVFDLDGFAPFFELVVCEGSFGLGDGEALGTLFGIDFSEGVLDDALP